MAYANAYSNYMYSSQPLNYSVSFDFLDKIAEKRGQSDEQAYRYMDDLKNKALNIRFLNQTGQKKVDEYNTEIDSFFKNTDLSKVDLADYKTANSYTKIFDKLSSDNTLVRAYQVDKQVQNTWNTWKESAKNPSKTGYSEANYNVWQNEHLMPYIQENNLSKLTTFDSGIFDPEYDYQKELKGLKSQVHFDGKKFDVLNSDGSKQTIDIQELTPEKLQIFFKGALSGKATAQMIKEAKSSFYNHYNSVPVEQRETLAKDLYEREKSKYDNIRINFQKQIEELKGKQSVASPEERERIQKDIDTYQNEANNFVFKNTINDYTSLSKVGLANQYAQSSLHDKISNYAKGMSYQIKKVTSGVNENYWKHKDLDFKINNEQYDRNRDKVKDAQWQMGYDLSVAKYQHGVEDDAAKNALKGVKSASDTKLAQSSNGFFSSYTEGDVDSGVTTIEDVDKILSQVNSQLKVVNPETLTKEQVKYYIDNNDNTPIGKTIKTYARQSGYNGVVTDNMLGGIKGYIKNELEQGNLHSHFNELKTQQRLYQTIKDRTWNKIMNEHIFPQNPQLKGATPEVVQKFFNNNPSLAKQVKELWNSELTSNMISVKGNSMNIDLDKDKTYHSRNLDLVTSILNSDKTTLNSIGIVEGKAITKDMISSAQYSPITGKTKVILKDDIDKEDSRGLNGKIITVDTPPAIRSQFGVDYSQKDKLAEVAGYYDGSYKKATYKISKDENNPNHWHVIIMKGDEVILNTLGGYTSSGEYRSAQPLESDSVTAIENKVIDIINKVK